MLKLIRTIMPREDRFFDMFERHAQILVAGADAMEQDVLGRRADSRVLRRDRRRTKMPPTTSPATCWSRCAARSSPRSTAARSPRSTSAMDDAIDEMWQTAKAITLYEVDQLRAADEGDERARQRGGAAGARGGAADAQHRPQRRPAARDHRGDRPSRGPGGRAPRRRPQGAVRGARARIGDGLHRRPRGLPPSRAGARRASRTSPTRSRAS